MRGRATAPLVEPELEVTTCLEPEPDLEVETEVEPEAETEAETTSGSELELKFMGDLDCGFGMGGVLQGWPEKVK